MGNAGSFDIGGMFKTVIDGIVNIGNVVGNAFTNFWSKVTSWFTDNIIKPAKQAWDQVKDFFRAIGAKFEQLGRAMGDIIGAIGLMFADIGMAIKTEGENIGNFIYGGGKCFMQFSNNFRRCMLFWLIDGLFEMIYGIILLICWSIEGATGLNIMKWLNKFKNMTSKIDSKLKKILGFSLMHYPDSVINDCYICKGVDFTRMVDKFNDGNNKIKGDFQRLTDIFKEVGDKFNTVFTSGLYG
jgi:hypothetical protein